MNDKHTFESGYTKEDETGKPRYDLIDKIMLYRWAEILRKGAEKYGERNYEQACTIKELNRFLSSAERHFQQWLNDLKLLINESEQKDIYPDTPFFLTDEDNAAAVLFNITGAENCYRRIVEKKGKEKPSK